MAKEKKNWFLVDIEVFCRNLLVIWGDKSATRKGLEDFFEDDVIDELMSDFTFKEDGRLVYSSQYNAYFIWLPKIPETVKEIGKLSHEIFHAVFALTENIGSVLSSDSEEFCAYLTGYLTEKILEDFSISFSA